MAQVLDRQADLEQDRERPAHARRAHPGAAAGAGRSPGGRPSDPPDRAAAARRAVAAIRLSGFRLLVSLGRHTTVGSLMGFLFGRGMFIEGIFARAMYHSLRLMHERTLNGTAYAVLGLLSRTLSRAAPGRR